MVSQFRRIAYNVQLILMSADLVRARALRDDSSILEDLIEVSGIHGALGNWARAVGLSLEAKGVALRIGDALSAAQADFQLGTAYGNLEVYDQSRQAYEASLTEFRARADHRHVVEALHGLAFNAERQGNATEAERLYTEAIEAAKDAHLSRHAADALFNLGVVRFRQKQYTTASGCWEEAARLLPRDRALQAKTAFYLGVAAHSLGENRRAARLLDESRIGYERLGLEDLAQRSDQYLNFVLGETEAASGG